MDDRRFDTLTRSLAEARSRRGALTGLLGGTLILLGLAETTAKKDKRRGKKKGKKKGGNSPPPPTAPTGPPPPICNPGTTEIAGRCAPLCGGPVNDPVCPSGCACRSAFDNNGTACVRRTTCENLLPCSSHSDCAPSQLCMMTDSCPVLNGVTTRCLTLC